MGDGGLGDLGEERETESGAEKPSIDSEMQMALRHVWRPHYCTAGEELRNR